ncbi:hypothetical protein QZH56_13740 [Streptomyces olivoreticuli]|uniref:hypothetical protein n=1 Tax=Streptomyces olivoreticuli TaxID=68246 RepID=UPI00265839DA|nr:hypothetical protein [Streptomyces olivoreticuli]WKK26555.1 hypothetical protein QZH56_13740 [Streptomyces olivoreticuli]
MDPFTLTCRLCDQAAAVQWQRRLTPGEFETVLAAEHARRDQAALLADPAQPPPSFGPMPDPAHYTTPVYACSPHAITLDAAALVHQATCTAPAAADLPGCSCTPEPVPSPNPEATATAALPGHWNT